MKSLMGQHFDPEHSDEAGYPETAYYWNSVKRMYHDGSDNVKFLIEALYHQIGGIEHNGFGSRMYRHGLAISYALTVSDTVGSMARADEVAQLNRTVTC